MGSAKSGRTTQLKPASMAAQQLLATGVRISTIAKVLKKDDSTIHRYLTGDRTPPLEVADRVEKIFGVKMQAWHQAPSSV